MKILSLAILLTSASAHASDPLPQRALDLAKSSINQFILINSGIQHAFPSDRVPDAVADAKVACVSAGTATVGFALLRTFHFSDDEIAPFLAPTSAKPRDIEALALSQARDCGLWF